MCGTEGAIWGAIDGETLRGMLGAMEARGMDGAMLGRMAGAMLGEGIDGARVDRG